MSMSSWVFSLTANVKVLCAVGDFGNEIFKLAHKPDRSTIFQLTENPPFFIHAVSGWAFHKLK